MLDPISYKKTKDVDEKYAVKTAVIEKELNDFQNTLANVNINQEAKQSVTGYGIVSLPKNCANGQVSASVKGQTWSNKLVVANIVTTITDNTGNRIKIKKDGSAGVKTAYDTTDYKEIDFVAGRKYFVVFKIKENSVGKIRNNIRIHYSDETTEGISLETDVFKAYNIIQATKTLKGQIYTATSPTVVGDKYFEYAFVYDLTELGLDNLTLEQADKLFYYINGTKSTVSATRTKSAGKNLFKNIFPYEGTPASYTFPSFSETQDLDKIDNFPFYVPFRTSSGYVAFKIPAVNGKTYTISGNRSTAYYSGLHDGLGRAVGNAVGVFSFQRISSRGYVFFVTTNVVFSDLKSYQVEEGSVQTSYEPYVSSSLYLNAGQPLRSLLNGTKDEVSAGKLAKRVGVKTNVASGTVINYADMAEGGQFVAYFADNTQQVGVKGDTLTALATTLTYQLATPVVTDIQTSGSLFGYPSGTVYVENVLPVAGLYEATGIKVTNSDFPIATLEKISKIDSVTGVETEVAVANAVISADKLSFTHPGLVAGDIVFFTYHHAVEGTVAETIINYYDSRYTIKDAGNGKFYQWKVTADNGVPTITLVEV